MTFSGPYRTVAIGNVKPRPGSRLRTYKYSLEHPVAVCGSKLPTLGGIKRTKGSEFELCLTSQIVTTLSSAFPPARYAFRIHTVDGCRRSARPYLKYPTRQPYRVLQNAFSRSILSGARRVEAFATRPSNGSWASSCAGRMQKERVKMMIVAACASVGRGPSDARPEHYHGRGPEPVLVFKRPKSWILNFGAGRSQPGHSRLVSMLHFGAHHLSGF